MVDPDSRAGARPLAGWPERTSLIAFVAGTAVGTTLAVGLAALRASSSELTSGAGAARSEFVEGPTASAPVGVAAQPAEVPTTTAALAPSEPPPPSADTRADEPPTAALAPDGPAPDGPAPDSPASEPVRPGRASRPSPTTRARAPARPRAAEVRAPASPRAPGTGEGSGPARTPTKAELARQISQLRVRQPALATTLTVELNELDAEDEASLRALASRIAAASSR